MNPQHFKELLGTVLKTSGCTQKEVAFQMGITTRTLRVWKIKGVPIRIKPFICNVLREMCFSGRLTNEYRNRQS